MSKKFLLLMITVMLITSNTYSVYASSTAGSITIGAGTSIGGLSNGVSSNTERNAIIITMLLMQGLGMTVHLADTAINAGTTAYNYVKSLFKKWVGGTEAEELSQSQEDELRSRFRVIEGGGGENPNEIGPDGQFYLNAGATGMISKFLEWLKEEGYIALGGSGSGQGSVNGDYYADGLTGCDNYNICVNTGVNGLDWITCPKLNVAWAKVRDGSKWEFFTYFKLPENTRYYLQYYQNWGNYGQNGGSECGYLRAPAGDIFAYRFTSSSYGTCDQLNDLVDITDIIGSGTGLQRAQRYFEYIGWNFSIDTSVDDDYIEGEYNSSDLSNPDGAYTIVDPGLISALESQVDTGNNLMLKMQDYINAIGENLNKQANPNYQPVPENIPAQNNANLQEQPLSYPDPIPVTVPITLPKDEPVPGGNNPPEDAEPVTDPDPAPPEISVPKMMFPLEEYFPFCIPFDIHALFMKLQGTPQAPSYTFEFTEPFSGAHVVIPVDLSIFNNAMVTVRKVEVVLYIVCLAVASRKFYAR